MQPRYSGVPRESVVADIGTSHSAIAARRATAPPAQRQPSPAVCIKPCQPRQRASAQGSSSISSPITPTPLVRTPWPAAKQPSQKAPQRDPRSKWISRTQFASVINIVTSGSNCACSIWWLNMTAPSTARLRGQQPGARHEQPAAQVPGQCQRHQPGEPRRQQERDAQLAGHGAGRRLQPHRQRRFVRVQLAAAAREQPVAGLHHLFGDEREARLVGRPGVAQPETGAQQRPRQRPAVGRRGGVHACGRCGCRSRRTNCRLRR